jgi:hypothetical protein
MMTDPNIMAQVGRRFYTVTGAEKFVIAEWDTSVGYSAKADLTRQEAWDLARTQDKPIVFVGLDEVEHVITPATKPEAPKPAKFVVTDGWFLLDGDVIKVQHNRAHTGFYAKRLVVTQEEGRKHGSWIYEPGLVKHMDGAVPMTFEAAQEYGDLYGVCFKCGAELTAEESIGRKMGPVCAGKMGW